MKKIFLSILALLFALWITAATNLHVSLPNSQGYTDLQRATNGQTEITSNPDDIVSLLQLINEYLRIAVGVICLAVLVIGGISLITGRGDEAKMKKANLMLLNSVIGIVIAIFSYLIVRLVLNIF